MMTRIIFIGLGGFAGSVLRYLLGVYVQRLWKGHEFPYATLLINVLGCILIGFLSQLFESQHVLREEVRLLLMVGFLGGFTTFSTFSNETWSLFTAGSEFLAILNLGMHLFLGLLGVFGGRYLFQVLRV